jgi:AcrR family transcriptional regulator
MAVRLTRVERKARTRDEILEAALQVFLRDGFHRATLDDIAEAAGYTTGAVYSNFDGKDGLFLALLDAQFAARIVPHVEQFRAASSLDEALQANARLLAETARREPLWAPLLVEFWTHASRDPRLRAEALWRHDRVLDSIGESLAMIAERFGVVWSRPTRELVRTASAFARGMAVERLLDPDAVPVESFEEEFVLFVNSHLRPAESEGART